MYPIFLKLRGEAALVAGGGKVAERKIRRLLACGAKLTVVSPTLNEALTKLEASGAFRWAPRAFKPSDLKGFRLAFALTDSRAVNESMARCARRMGIWVNAAHALDDATFHTPGAVQRGALTIAVSTGGQSPALAKQMREELEERYGHAYEELTALMGEARGQADEAALECLREGDVDGALNILRAWKEKRNECES